MNDALLSVNRPRCNTAQTREVWRIPLQRALANSGESHHRVSWAGWFSVVSLLMAGLLSSSLFADDSWWQFRGPTGDGHATSESLPMTWSESSNIAWKTAIHDRGWSSPVICGDQIWVTTATEEGHKLYAVCVDKSTGEIVHDLHIFDVEKPMKITRDNTYATPTPVVQAGRVIVHYGTYGTACIETSSGRVVWTRRDLTCDHEVGAGPASSPTLIDGKLVVHVDGRDVQYIIALDPATGKTVWKTDRSIDFAKIPVHHRKAFCMPTVAPRGQGGQIISPGGRALYSYDLSGKELWRVQHRGFSIAPRPVVGHGMVFTTIDRDQPELWGIRYDGKGDVTDTHVAWKVTRAMPPRCSPLLVVDLLFVVNREGVATCLEATTGDIVWKERLKGQFSASPIYSKGRIYLFNEEASCTIIRPSRMYSVAAENSLETQALCATPAVDGNALIVRTEHYLYRIEAGAKSKSPPVNAFVGNWDIGRSAPSVEPKFVMTLNANGTARKSHVPKATGRWEVVGDEARITWSDGWRDIIRPAGNGFRKIAFKPGTDFNSPPSNTDAAERSRP